MVVVSIFLSYTGTPARAVLPRSSWPTQVGTTPRLSFRALVEPDGRVEIEAALKRMQSILLQP
jgi:hypothetical protein